MQKWRKQLRWTNAARSSSCSTAYCHSVQVADIRHLGLGYITWLQRRWNRLFLSSPFPSIWHRLKKSSNQDDTEPYCYIRELEAEQRPTCSPPGARRRDSAFLAYLQTGYATATKRMTFKNQPIEYGRMKTGCVNFHQHAPQIGYYSNVPWASRHNFNILL